MGIKSLAPLAALLVLGTGLAACGNDSDSSTEAAAGGGQQIDVTAVDYAFEGLPDTLEQGPVSVSFKNEGDEDHMLVFGKLNEGVTLDEVKRSDVTELGTIPPTAPGEESQATISTEISEPGNYFMLCPLKTKDGKNHYDLGQEYEFTVE